MQLPDTLTDAQNAAIVECLRIFAELGADEIEDEQKTELPSNLAGAGNPVDDSATLTREHCHEQEYSKN